jgi:plasmid maintenance system antidote protein VapI
MVSQTRAEELRCPRAREHEELARVLGVSVHEAQKRMEEHSAARSQRSIENRMQVTRSDSDKLAVELGMSKEDARGIINENNDAMKRLAASKQTFTRVGADNLAALLGLPVTEVKQLMRQSIEPAPTAPKVSDADMALALTLQEQSDLESARDGKAQLQMDAALSQKLSEPEF